MLVQPLVQSLALRPSSTEKAWAGHLLAILESASDHAPVPMAPGLPPLCERGEVAAAAELLVSLRGAAITLPSMRCPTCHTGIIRWADTLARWAEAIYRVPAGKAGAAAALRWLSAFRRLAQQGNGAETQSLVLSPAVCMLLTALLLHGDPAVQLGAVQAASAVAVSRPLMGIAFLPLLIYLLQRPATRGDLLLYTGKCSLRICISYLYTEPNR